MNNFQFCSLIHLQFLIYPNPVRFQDSLVFDSILEWLCDHLTMPINHQIRYYFDFDSCILVMNGENGSFTSYALNANFDSSSSRSLSFLCRTVFRRTSTISIYSCILLRVLDGCIVLSPYHTVILSFRFILQLSSSRKHSDFSSETPS